MERLLFDLGGAAADEFAFLVVEELGLHDPHCLFQRQASCVKVIGTAVILYPTIGRLGHLGPALETFTVLDNPLAEPRPACQHRFMRNADHVRSILSSIGDQEAVSHKACDQFAAAGSGFEMALGGAAAHRRFTLACANRD